MSMHDGVCWSMQFFRQNELLNNSFNGGLLLFLTASEIDDILLGKG